MTRQKIKKGDESSRAEWASLHLTQNASQWRKGAVIIVKNKYQPSLGTASVPGVVLPLTLDYFISS